MDMGTQLIERLTAAAERLPPAKAQEVLDFVEFLLAREEQSRATGGAESSSDKDPILGYIGGISHGSLAHNIDGDIYGE